MWIFRVLLSSVLRGPLSKRRLFRMGAFLDKPKVEKHTESGAGNGLRYALASMQGWRVEMEDAHCAMLGLPCGGGLDRWSFFAVFDGHAGARVSAHCAQNLLDAICQTDEFAHTVAASDVGEGGGEEELAERVATGIRRGFLCLDDQMRALPEVASGEDKSGSTAVCALVSPGHVYFANCGDSRALLCRHGQPAFTTRDHKPINPGEKERIQRAGGSVMIQRVNGSLAVSRALGDFEYKQVAGRGPCEQLVSPEPEVTVQARDPEADEFLVLACDGIWDVMSNEELCHFVHHQLCISHRLEELCAAVIDICLYRGSKDNMSIVLVLFPGAPSVSDEALQHDRELNALIDKRITEMVAESPDMELNTIIQTLAEEDLPGLPPGGGILAKRSFIEEVYSKLKPPSTSSEPVPPVRCGKSLL
ncbi:protein phosphatase alphabet isoform X2 [Haemaphysalis longicornis]